jgi:hypothetical protein
MEQKNTVIILRKKAFGKPGEKAVLSKAGKELFKTP